MAKWVDTRRKDGTLMYSECFLGRFKLIVHHYMSLSYDQWWLSCEGLFDNTFLCHGKFTEAKPQAITKLQIILNEALDEILKDCK